MDAALAHRYLGDLLAKLGRYSGPLPHLEAAQRIHNAVDIARDAQATPECQTGLRVHTRAQSTRRGTSISGRTSGQPGALPQALHHLEAAQRIHNAVDIAREVDRVREQAAGRKESARYSTSSSNCKAAAAAWSAFFCASTIAIHSLRMASGFPVRSMIWVLVSTVSFK